MFFRGMSESCEFTCWYLKNTKNSDRSDFHQFGWAREPGKVAKIVIFGYFKT